MSEITQNPGIEPDKKFSSPVAVVGDVIKPFLPLTAAISLTINEIVKAYENVRYNRKMCGALFDRVLVAEASIKILERRQKYEGEKFSRQDYYEAFHKFLALL